MVDVWHVSELGMVLPSRRAALHGTFRAEPEAIPGLEAPHPSCQCTELDDYRSFCVHCLVEIGWKVRDWDDTLLLLLLLETPRYVRVYYG